MDLKRITARDVAALAGVSQSTVSYVLNDTPTQSISAATTERVLAAAAELGYTPSAAARALRRGTSETVVVLLPEVPVGGTISAFLEQFSDELEPHGLTTIYRRQRADQGLLPLWQELMPAAVVNVFALPLADVARMEGRGIPIIGSHLDRPEDRGLSVPQEAIGQMQVRHLAQQGHVRIGYAASIDPRVTAFLKARIAGAQQACLELGLPAPVVLDVAPDVGLAADAVRVWRAGAEPVTAICAYNDEVAFAVMAGLRRLALKVPQDVALIGVDNVLFAPFADPPLTSIDVHTELLARQLAQMVLSRLNLGGPVPDTQVAVIELVPRASA
ncbi:LacI family DNA-binding transcriptional regulator [Cellulomonas sp. WB94]|uniref:LacI family DNA-binding transcriptional regulator n=1 Tax=Cellulomonas sp. WB94 TaxID=2173174 RepID=UPI001F5BDDA0|nr:LacI family DNA-binding transcriptional regulator [Cellulomonas sp. WB94]